MSPAETAVIAGDVAIKNANVELGFVDRFSGTLIVTGLVLEVEAAMHAIVSYCEEKLKFTICDVTKT